MTDPKNIENDSNELTPDEMKKVVGGLKGVGSSGGDQDTNDYSGGAYLDGLEINPLVSGANDDISLVLNRPSETSMITRKVGGDDPEKIRPV